MSPILSTNIGHQSVGPFTIANKTSTAFKHLPKKYFKAKRNCALISVEGPIQYITSVKVWEFYLIDIMYHNLVGNSTLEMQITMKSSIFDQKIVAITEFHYNSY